MDSLGISTVLEGCRQLTKVAFNQINIAQTVFEHMAQKSTELQVGCKPLDTTGCCCHIFRLVIDI